MARLQIMLLASIVLLLLLLTGCQQQNTLVATTPETEFAEKLAEKQKCANVMCGQNEQCSGGECVCADKYKSCNGTCIPTEGCCIQDDCDDEHFCAENNKCHLSPQTCDYYEEWNAEKEACDCTQGTKFCQAQNKCIPENHCCTPTDCTFRRDICVPTNYAAGVCVRDPSLHCKTIVEGNQARFTIDNTPLKITVTNIFEKGNTALRIEDAVKTMQFNTTEQLTQQATISVEHIKNLGGTCKLFND